MRFNREAITQALAAIPGNFEMRLYVDGDFANMQDVDFGCLNLATTQIKAYGYKSFALLLAYNLVNTWPENYMLTFQADTMQALKWSNMSKLCQSHAASLSR
jgi:hypothetical protein